MNLFMDSIVSKCVEVFKEIESFDIDDQVETINKIRTELHKISPFASEPVDCVLWVKSDKIRANDYNPNSVAPPEMKLLAHSILEDGYTQPIVSWQDGEMLEVVDGYHRNRVGREVVEVRERVKGYLPVTVANSSRTDRGDRIAATIRHNRARGKHRIDAMSEIVVELKRRFWTDEKIGKELGMDPDEVLRLTQITGLAEMFSDREFSQAWEAEISTEINEDDNITITEEIASKESPSPLPKVGRLEGRDVSGNTKSSPPSGNRRRRKVAKDTIATPISNEESPQEMAGLFGSQLEQSCEKQTGVDRPSGVLFDHGNAGLPYETFVAHANGKPAKTGKRRSR